MSIREMCVKSAQNHTAKEHSVSRKSSGASACSRDASAREVASASDLSARRAGVITSTLVGQSPCPGDW